MRAGHGVVGDRCAGRPAHRDEQLTVLAVESLEAVAAETGSDPVRPARGPGPGGAPTSAGGA